MKAPKLCGERVDLHYLSLDDIESYLRQFSETIQTCLQVHDCESEREYLIARCIQDAFFIRFKQKMKPL